MGRFIPTAILALLLTLTIVAADTRTAVVLTADSLRIGATLHSIGIEWDIIGDADHDATGSVRYRAAGDNTWRNGPPLLRVDFQGFFSSQTADRHYNMLAGSLFFLQPGTDYELELNLDDPDGGDTSRRLQFATRPEPQLSDGPILWVGPVDQSGDGTRERPLSLAEAVRTATPGTRFCLLGGQYGETRLAQSGEPGRRIAWLGPEVPACGATSDSAVFARLEVAASHQWIEGLFFRWNEAWPDSVTRGALKADGAVIDNVVRGNRFRDYAYSIWLHPDSDGWTITDNDIVGRKDIETEGNAAFSGEGIELAYSSDHTVAYNSISQVADGISYAKRNCDLFGNDIRDTSDDGIEPDYGYGNIRMWGNRIANVQYFAFSFQGMHSAPWYMLRNQVTLARGGLLKFRVTDRFVFVNNTVIVPSIAADMMHHCLHGTLKNNLFIRDGEQMRNPWVARLAYRGDSIEKRYVNPDLTEPNWQTDWSHNGYDLRGPDGISAPLRWFDREFATVNDLADAVGIDMGSRHVDRDSVFTNYTTPTNPARIPGSVLQLRPGSAAIDAGSVIPGLVESFGGSAPDLGALELGAAPPHYGVRPRDERHRWIQTAHRR